MAPRSDDFWPLLFIFFFAEYLTTIFVVLAYFGAIQTAGPISDNELYSAMRSVPTTDFLYATFGVVAVSIVKGSGRAPLSLLVIFGGFLLLTSQIFQWVPNDLIYSEQSALIKQTLTFALLTLSASIMWIPVNATLVILILISNLHIALKNDSAQRVPVPSDLAQDLWLSRSHARRSRTGR